MYQTIPPAPPPAYSQKFKKPKEKFKLDQLFEVLKLVSKIKGNIT